MKILVTGGAGFIGSNVVDAYLKLGHQVIVVDDLSTGKQDYVNPSCKFYKADVSTAEFASIILNEKPDVINHHAAQIDVRKSVDDPGFDAQINILGIINVCQTGLKAKVKKVIFSSSGGVLYGEVPSTPASESAPISPLCPYGVSKYASELYLRYFNHQYGMRFTSLRYANVYGPRQIGGEAGVVAIFIRNMLEGKPTVIFGDGRQERDFVFVEDVARANVLALEKGDNESINIGTARTVSVNELHQLLAQITNYRGKAENVPSRPGELNRNVLAVDFAHTSLGWRPTTSLEAGLKITTDWFKSLPLDFPPNSE